MRPVTGRVATTVPGVALSKLAMELAVEIQTVSAAAGSETRAKASSVARVLCIEQVLLFRAVVGDRRLSLATNEVSSRMSRDGGDTTPSPRL
jgi:hypothetical protein